MYNSAHRSSVEEHIGVACDILFFVAFYLYLWLIVDLRLLYHGGGLIENFPVFYCGRPFLETFLTRPGGLSEYSSAFLSQFFNIGWAGALVVTVQAWLITLFADGIIKSVGCLNLRSLRFVPALALLVLYGQYTYHFPAAMTVLAALMAAYLFLIVARPSWPCVHGLEARATGLLRFAMFLAMLLVVYVLAGGAYLVFAAVCFVYELLFARRWKNAILYGLSAAILPYLLGVLVFGVSILDAYGIGLPFHWETVYYEGRREILAVVYALYLFAPAILTVAGLWRLLASKPRATGGRLWAVAGNVLIFVCAGLVAFFTCDGKKKSMMTIDYLACEGRWDQLLTAAKRDPGQYLVNHVVNRALYHKGLLASDMFCWPQNPQSLLLTAKEALVSDWKRFDIYLDLGQINLAEHSLIQCIDTFGERPLILRRLAIVNMVKGNIGVARVYLGALSRTFFDADWANRYLEKIEIDSNLPGDDLVQHLRSIMVNKDRSFDALNINIITDPLERNKQNQMAFEYLMAHYLLTVQLDEFVRNLGRLNDFGYQQIPRAYEEAILLYMASRNKTVDLGKRQISAETRQRFEVFRQIYFGMYRANKQAAFRDLARQFGETYMFYAGYGISGVKGR